MREIGQTRRVAARRRWYMLVFNLSVILGIVKSKRRSFLLKYKTINPPPTGFSFLSFFPFFPFFSLHVSQKCHIGMICRNVMVFGPHLNNIFATMTRCGATSTLTM